MNQIRYDIQNIKIHKEILFYHIRLPCGIALKVYGPLLRVMKIAQPMLFQFPLFKNADGSFSTSNMRGHAS